MRQLLILVFTAILFANCNSNKGWSAADKQKGLKGCMDEVEGKVDNDVAKKYCNCALEKAMAKYPTYAAAEKGTDEEGTKIAMSCAKELGLKTNGGGGDEDVMEEGGGKKKGGLFGGGDDEETGGGKKKGGGLFGGGDDEETGGGGKQIDDDENDNGNRGSSWTSSQRRTYIEGCASVAKQSMSSSKANSYCECMQGKMEKKYKMSYAQANKLTAEDFSTPEAKAEIQECLGN